ncbi:hypothetical protein BC628DRAFT_1308562 [Trametes gibbosa]|nr:hypothetical protein BC628DRAFT_1308562 [Trametes gibbosa]
MASMRRALNRQKEEANIAKATCTYCGKDGGAASLKSCSRCKAARYCDQTCQLADFKSRHKRECANFLHPPTTSAFLTKPIANERYSHQPVFAHWHEDGVGCWVGVAGRIDCDLQHLSEAMDSAEHQARQDRMMGQGAAAARQILRTHKAAARSLLVLHVLVQNRRKEKDPILLFASRAQVVSQPSLTATVERGTAEGDSLIKFTKDRLTRAAMSVATDPWDKAPRLKTSHINGVEFKKETPTPANIKDVKAGTIVLHTGEYAVLHLQFRVGDGDTISKDWEALGCLEAIHLPWASWDGAVSPATVAATLPSAQSPPQPPSGTSEVGSSTSPGQARAHLLRAPFDQLAIRAHYADFIERGEEAYMRSHYGDARTDMTRNAEGMLAAMSEILLGQVAQAGSTDILAQRLRESGLDDIADKIAGRR